MYEYTQKRSVVAIAMSAKSMRYAYSFKVCAAELDHLHHFGSITITPSNFSITLQLLCAKKNQNIIFFTFETYYKLQLQILLIKWKQDTQTCWNDYRSGTRIRFLRALENSTHFSPRIQQPFAYFYTSRIPRIHRASLTFPTNVATQQ